MVCHGAYAVSSGVAPDLRRMSAETHEIFNEIVREGLYKENGMVGFGDWLTEEDTHDIRAYVIERANISRAALAEAPEGESPAGEEGETTPDDAG